MQNKNRRQSKSLEIDKDRSKFRQFQGKQKIL